MDDKSLVADITDLASLPGVCLRVMELADDPKASAADLAEVISHDPGLAARLLKLVNSAYFGLRNPVDDLGMAVRVCGTESLRTLALATGAVSAFKDIPNDLVDMDAYWNASVHCGLLAAHCRSRQRPQRVHPGKTQIASRDDLDVIALVLDQRWRDADG